ncbi:MAG: winged helix-turn-helix domain-containing protein [Jatrophihabitantaceae bacterium]
MSEAAPRPAHGRADPDLLTGGDVVLDRAAHRVTVDGHAVELALQEFRLLDLLMDRADHVVPSMTILESLWGLPFTGDPGTVAVHILRLRKKLDRWDGASRHVRTVRGIGYVFDTEPSDD